MKLKIKTTCLKICGIAPNFENTSEILIMLSLI